MATELIAQPETALAPQLHLVATNGDQIRTAQHELVAFFRAKLDETKQEHRDAEHNLRVAARAGFKLSTYERPVNLAVRRITYYEKCLAAVEAGYLIVPNMPLTLFAIRTNRQCPRGGQQTYNEGERQRAPGLPIGEGEHVGEFPEMRAIDRYVTDKATGLSNPKTFYSPKDFACVDYPVAVAEPRVMEATAAAMARKVFDSVGVVVDERRGDPIVVGRVCLNGTWNTPMISFLIAWYIDTKTL